MEHTLPKIVSFSLMLFSMTIIIIALPTFQAHVHVGDDDDGKEAKPSYLDAHSYSVFIFGSSFSGGRASTSKPIKALAPKRR